MTDCDEYFYTYPNFATTKTNHLDNSKTVGLGV